MVNFVKVRRNTDRILITDIVSVLAWCTITVHNMAHELLTRILLSWNCAAKGAAGIIFLMRIFRPGTKSTRGLYDRGETPMLEFGCTQ